MAELIEVCYNSVNLTTFFFLSFIVTLEVDIAIVLPILQLRKV